MEAIKRYIQADNNLEDLRAQLTRRLGLIYMALFGFGAWLSLTTRYNFSLATFLLFLCLAAAGAAANFLAHNRPLLARSILSGGLVTGLVLGMLVLPNPFVPFAGIMIIFSNAVLFAKSEYLTSLIFLFAAAWLTLTGQRGYPMAEYTAAMAVSALVASATVSMLSTSLEWTQYMQHETRQMLEETRQQRGELARVLKELKQANELQRRTELELVQARQRADEARQKKEAFAANISHELRTPLNLILGFSEVMHLTPQVYRGVQWTQALRSDIYQIYRSGRYLLSMIDDILDLAHIEMSGLPIHPEPTPLTPFLEEVAGLSENLFCFGAVQFEANIEPDLPVLSIDRTRINQVLINLLNNARRFTEKGYVRLEAYEEPGKVILQVSDTGSGIPEDKLASIFEEFYQVDSSLSRRNGGIGLGLAISKRLVDAHGGNLWVESKVGSGSSFFLSLPVAERHSQAKHKVGSDEYQSPWQAEQPCLLVVDPDPTVTNLIQRRLVDLKVIQVHEKELGEIVERCHPQAVIINRPPDQGMQPPPALLVPIPIIQCSFSSSSWLIQDSNAAACFTKPVPAGQLLETIDQIGNVEDILIIDDDRGFVQLIERMLQANRADLNLRRAYDGRQGLAAMQDRRPDLVLLDLKMPEMDGFEVLKQMKLDLNTQTVPVIFLTASSYERDLMGQPASYLIIYQHGGIRPNEGLACLTAVLESIHPRYGERS